MGDIKVPHLNIEMFDPVKFSENLSSEKSENSNINNSTDDLNNTREDFFNDVELLLHGMGMEKYADLFYKERIDLNTFLHLQLNDLNELGITDPDDSEIFIKTLKAHQLKTDSFLVLENHFEDLKIAKNIYNMLIMQQNYCSYLDLQMKRHKLTDYKINSEQTAVTYLKAFTESALTQAQIMTNLLFNANNSNHLIGKAMKINDIKLPKHLSEKLIVKKSKKKIFCTLFATTSLFTILLFIKRRFMNTS